MSRWVQLKSILPTGGDPSTAVGMTLLEAGGMTLLEAGGMTLLEAGGKTIIEAGETTTLGWLTNT